MATFCIKEEIVSSSADAAPMSKCASSIHYSHHITRTFIGPIQRKNSASANNEEMNCCSLATTPHHTLAGQPDHNQCHILYPVSSLASVWVQKNNLHIILKLSTQGGATPLQAVIFGVNNSRNSGLPSPCPPVSPSTGDSA